MDTAEEVVRELREKLRLCPLPGGAGNPRGGVGIGMRIEDSEETDAPWFDPGTGERRTTCVLTRSAFFSLQKRRRFVHSSTNGVHSL